LPAIGPAFISRSTPIPPYFLPFYLLAAKTHLARFLFAAPFSRRLFRRTTFRGLFFKALFSKHSIFRLHLALFTLSSTRWTFVLRVHAKTNASFRFIAARR
jgi:hypothetical protein